MLCQADNLHYCGGPDRLNLYKYNGVVPTPTNPPAGGGGGGNGNAVGPVTSGLPGTWHYVGCYVDGVNGRILSYTSPNSNTNSAQECISKCTAAGFTLSALQFTNECYCSNAIVNGGVKAASDAECNMPCSGDAAHACGAGNRDSLYASVDTFPTYGKPAVLKTGLPGKYAYVGCYVDAPGGQRAFPYQIINQAANTVQSCLAQCSAYGFDVASLEFGSECYCASGSDLAKLTAAPEADCNIACPGSPADLCGGVARLNVYSWSTTDPLYVWNKPANAGRYELLIGGIVIPLIATLGINNKVNFMEKFGTGAPNSTGAYELDYSLANDYKKAWREMHVSSDVFCAANLVLPDRKGRIISVGGWSLDSTRGIRFYTPSGSQGVNGTTDWEEVYDSLHLQVCIFLIHYNDD